MNKTTRLVALLCLAHGIALGGFLDIGLARVLPSAPWPPPPASGFGIIIGAGIALGTFLLLKKSIEHGSYKQVQPARVNVILHQGVTFVLTCALIGGFIGFSSAKRDIADRPMAQLREARRDVDKGFVTKIDGQKFILKAQEKIVSAKDPAREHRNMRVFASTFAIIGTVIAAVFVSLIILQERIKTTLAAQGISEAAVG